MSDRAFEYSIDRDDRVASVSDAWLGFARDNCAPELTREYVVGQSLWSFLAGGETRLLFKDLFLRVRTGTEAIELPFRCDSPDRFRFMRLVLTPGPQDSIDCKGILEREQERPFYSILDQAFPRTQDSLSVCSVCKRVWAHKSKWLELEEAIREMNLFDSPEVPEIRHTLCDDCRSASRRPTGGAAAA